MRRIHNFLLLSGCFVIFTFVGFFIGLLWLTFQTVCTPMIAMGSVREWLDEKQKQQTT